jgi:hypothetical protein
LNGRWSFVTLVIDRILQRLDQIQFGKCVQWNPIGAADGVSSIELPVENAWFTQRSGNQSQGLKRESGVAKQTTLEELSS